MTTITVYTDESASSSSSNSVPVGAIAGGIAAGACLALGIVVIWMLRSRRRQQTHARTSSLSVSKVH